VLTDVVMPKMSGVELTSMLRASYPSLRVLLMSGYAGYPGYEMPNLPKDVPLLQKPFTPGTLAASVRAALDGGRAPVPAHN
jgi:two-component system cell cycle sensor histidine kinase/response regulator CckA